MTNMDRALLRHITSRFGGASFLDLGCGPGGMMDLAKQFQWTDVWGIDGDPALVRDDLIHHDFTLGPFLWNDKFPETFDLCWCVEFVEHIEERFLGNVMSVLNRCDYVLLTHAVPGQGGHHHVNLKDDEYWERVMETFGFVMENKETKEIREVAENQYTKNTGALYRNFLRRVSVY